VDPLNEGIGATEELGLATRVHDQIGWSTHWKLEKREGDGATYPGGIDAFKRDVKPYEVLEFDGNLLVNMGGHAMWDILTATGPVHACFTNALANLGVGDSAAAEAVGQVDLQAGPNKLRKAMNGGYPTYTNMVVTFQSDFTGAEATWTWAEVGTFNAAAAGDMLNRKVSALGVKGAGATWTLTETITLS